MRTENAFKVWLPEPTSADESYAHRGEHALDWLARSTNVRAQACRRFLNQNLARLPGEFQKKLRARAKHQWNSVFFELVVFRILQELGAEEILVEQSIESGKKPDFSARFADGSIIVETVSPAINSDAAAELRNRIPLLDYIGQNAPVGWKIGVSRLPRIGPADSKKDFKNAVAQMFERLSSMETRHEVHLEDRIPAGRIVLLAVPGQSGEKHRLLYEAPIAAWDNSEARIQHALSKKKGQVRHAGAPVLLAVQASGISSDWGDFDKALYGHTFDRYDASLRLVETGFEADWAFTSHPENLPTFAGVLAFLDVGFCGGPAPVLYRDPRYSGNLPASVQQLEQRCFNVETKEIVSYPSGIADLMSRLDFVDIA